MPAAPLGDWSLPAGARALRAAVRALSGAPLLLSHSGFGIASFKFFMFIPHIQSPAIYVDWFTAF